MVDLILCAGVRERHFLLARFSATGMAGSRKATPFEGAGDGYPVCAGVRGRQEAADEEKQVADFGGPPDELTRNFDFTGRMFLT